MLPEFLTSLDWIAWPGQIGLLVADSGTPTETAGVGAPAER